MTSRRHTTAASRFPMFVQIIPTDECIIWPGAKTDRGYGIINEYGKPKVATHVALEIDGRPRTSSLMFALHRCDNPSCVNPRHLFWGSHQDNMRDQQQKGRHWATLRSTCGSGHFWDSQNTRIGKDGRKNCRICEASRVVKRREQRRAARNSGNE